MAGAAVVFAWVLYTGVFLGRFRSAQRFERWLEAVCAGVVTAALGGVLAMEFCGATGPVVLWLQIALTATAVTGILVSSWVASRAVRFAVSFAADFSVCFGASGALVGVLLVLAFRLYPLAPFGALLVGMLSFFLPVNALAEVFHSGAKASQNRKRVGSRRRHK